MKNFLTFACFIALIGHEALNQVDAGSVGDHFQRFTDHVHHYLSKGNSKSASSSDPTMDNNGEHTIKDRNVDANSSPDSPVDPLSRNGDDDDDLVVKTTLGLVKGVIETSRSGFNYTAFKGIRYGVAKRFERAELVMPWEGTLDALNDSSICPQFSAQVKDIIGVEDCLHINIYVPTSDRCKKEKVLPTYFSIHGGAFTEGFGALYSPKYFMDECVTFVSNNYRLGALGFLASNDGVLEGNLGLKDTLLALKFYRDNAAAFRSDKDLITINGISAGSAIVSHFIVSPAAKGLFSRAISQSGSALADWAIIRNPSQEVEKLGRYLNCTGSSSKELKACFLSTDVKTLLANQEFSVDSIFVPRWKIKKFLVGPVIEPETAEEPFISKHPYLRYKTGDFNRVPLISGFTKDEGILLQAGAVIKNPGAVKDMNTEWRRVSPIAFLYDRLNLTEEESNRISDRIREFFFGNKSVSEETYAALVDINSDRFFVQSTLKSNELHSKFAPVYPYVFSYLGPYSLVQTVLKLKEPVVSHGHDAHYLYSRAPEFPPGSEAEELSKNLVKMWVHFSKTGEPGKTWSEGVFWKQPSDRITFNIDNPASNLVDYLHERKEFWDSLGLYDKEFA